jgi:hypothetical protein
VKLDFAGAGTARVQMVVTKPGGEIHGPPPYDSQFTGGAGDLERIYFTLRTLS